MITFKRPVRPQAPQADVRVCVNEQQITFFEAGPSKTATVHFTNGSAIVVDESFEDIVTALKEQFE